MYNKEFAEKVNENIASNLFARKMQFKCPLCKATVHGLRSEGSQPWIAVCKKCGADNVE